MRVLFARHLHMRGARNPRARNLRCDQECHHDGWQAYESEKLIHRKHGLSSPKMTANGAFNSPVASADRWSEAGLYRPPRKS